MRLALVDDLEDFVRRGALWDPVELASLVSRLEAESSAVGDPILALLAQPLRSLLLRIGMGPIAPRTAADFDGIVYPRLWKVMEAVRDGMPDTELRTRIEAFNRRMAQRLALETTAGTGS